MNELVSIIMTSYNYANYIAEAIESVINQTYKNWELIIIDDASTDNSVDIINNYLNDSRIKLYINEENLGLAKSLKKGIDLASGNWIAFLESDDILHPDSVKKRIEKTALGADIVFSNFYFIGDEKQIKQRQSYINYLNEKIFNVDSSQFVINVKKYINQTNFIATFSIVLVRKSLVEKCDFNPLHKAALDLYLWAQLSDYKFYYLSDKLTYWRLHPASYINKCYISKKNEILFAIQVYCKTLKQGFSFFKILSILNFLRKQIIYITFSNKHCKISILRNTFTFNFKLM